MWLLILVPFFLQGTIIALDELCFHLKRGLPRWERLGHPLDTLSVIACFAFVLGVPFSPGALKGYIALSLFSCLFVTKDEFVHKHHCPAAEQWLHALLFLNHPVLLTSLGLLWHSLWASSPLSWLSPWQNSLPELKLFIAIQGLGAFLFMFYQIVYWNFIWREKVK